jgi:hypothetical protein
VASPNLSDDEQEALRNMREGRDTDMADADLIADAVGMERESALVRRYGDTFSIALANRYLRAAAALRRVARGMTDSGDHE